MKNLTALLLYGVGITVGCSCVVYCLWVLVQFLFELPLNANGIMLASGQ